VVLSGPDPAEQELARRVAEAGEGVAAAVGEELVRLGPLKPLVRDAAFMLSTDSGPRHFAVALGTPHVALLGPTDPRFTGRHLERARVVRRPPPCSPCHLRTCVLGHHRCLREITPEMVLAAVAELGEEGLLPSAPPAP
jgi:heptosyltransferase-2